MTEKDMQCHCWVYRCSKKREMYIYLAKEADFDSIPESLRLSLGELSLVIRLELDESKKLAKEDVVQVMKNLDENGFHLQFPDNLEPYMYEGD